MFVVNDDVEDQPGPHEPFAAAVLDLIGARANVKRIAFSEVRQALKKTAEQLPDGYIHQICIDAGIRVDGE